MKSKETNESSADLIKKLIIVQLGLAGVPRANIRAIVGGDTNRVASILRHLPRKPRREIAKAT